MTRVLVGVVGLAAVFAGLPSIAVAEKIKVVFKHPNWDPLGLGLKGADGKALPTTAPAPPTVPVPPVAGEPNEEGEAVNAKLGNGDIPKSALEEIPWGSNGYPRGGLHKNNTGVTLTEIVIKLEAPDEFDPASVTDSAGFGMPMLSDDKRTLTFKNLSIAPCQGVWSMVPWSKKKVAPLGVTEDETQAPRGTDTAAKGVYKGKAVEGTPQAPKPQKKEEPAKDGDKSGDKKTGPAGQQTGGQQQSQAAFDGSEHVFFILAPVQYVEFVAGAAAPLLEEPTTWEDLIGAQVFLTGLHLEGPSAEVPGAWRMGDQVIEIVKGSSIFLNGSMTRVLLVPDNSIPGYDSVIQATISWPQSGGGVRSRFVDRVTEDSAAQREMGFFIRTNLLSATAGLTQPGLANMEYMWTTLQPPFTCPGDTNGDEKVNNLDFITMFEAFQQGVECEGCLVDIDGDGAVSIVDLIIMRQNWGPCPLE